MEESRQMVLLSLSSVPQYHFEEDPCLLRYVAAVQLFRSTKVSLFRGWRGIFWRGGGANVVGVDVVCGSVEAGGVEKRGVLPVRSVNGS